MNKNKIIMNYNRLGLAIIIIGVLFAVLYTLSPFYYDDLVYLKGTYGLDDKLEALKITWATCVDYMCFNASSRFTNLLAAPLLTIVPHWLFSVVTAAVFILSIYCSLKLVRVNLLSGRALAIIATFVLLLPWSDHMTAVMYAINYVWATAITLLSVYLIFKRLNGAEPSYIITRIGEIIICYIAGWFHEGFSLPVIAGLFIYLAINQSVIKNRYGLTLVVAYGLGLVTLLSFPGTWSRVGDSQIGSWNYYLYSLVRFYWLPMIFLITAFLKVRTKEFRQRIKMSGSHNLALLGMLMCAEVVSFMFFRFYTGPRTSWFPMVIAVIGMAHIQSISPLIHFKTERCRQFFTAVCFVAIYINLSAAIIKQMEINVARQEVLELYNKSQDGLVYYDAPYYVPGLDLGKTSATEFDDDYTAYCYSVYIGGPRLKIVRSYDPDEKRWWRRLWK